MAIPDDRKNQALLRRYEGLREKAVDITATCSTRTMFVTLTEGENPVMIIGGSLDLCVQFLQSNFLDIDPTRTGYESCTVPLIGDLSFDTMEGDEPITETVNLRGAIGLVLDHECFPCKYHWVVAAPIWWPEEIDYASFCKKRTASGIAPPIDQMRLVMSTFKEFNEKRRAALMSGDIDEIRKYVPLRDTVLPANERSGRMYKRTGGVQPDGPRRQPAKKNAGEDDRSVRTRNEITVVEESIDNLNESGEKDEKGGAMKREKKPSQKKFHGSITVAEESVDILNGGEEMPLPHWNSVEPSEDTVASLNEKKTEGIPAMSTLSSIPSQATTVIEKPKKPIVGRLSRKQAPPPDRQPLRGTMNENIDERGNENEDHIVIRGHPSLPPSIDPAESFDVEEIEHSTVIEKVNDKTKYGQDEFSPPKTDDGTIVRYVSNDPPPHRAMKKIEERSPMQPMATATGGGVMAMVQRRKRKRLSHDEK